MLLGALGAGLLGNRLVNLAGKGLNRTRHNFRCHFIH